MTTGEFEIIALTNCKWERDIEKEIDRETDEKIEKDNANEISIEIDREMERETEEGESLPHVCGENLEHLT